MSIDVVLVAECLQDGVLSVSRELTGAAARLAPSPADTIYVAAGSDVTAAATELARQTGVAVRTLSHKAFACPHPELLATAVTELAAAENATHICYPHTACGCQAAAKTAVNLEAACITAVENITAETDTIHFRKALCNGKLHLKITADTAPVVITVLPGAFQPAENAVNRPGQVEPVDFLPPVEEPGYYPLGLASLHDANDADLEKADIIVAAGRGIGEEENLKLIQKVAAALPRAAVAASRPLCDLKWLPYSRQVGATGKTVAPRLYLACGISGAQQHLQGMQGSQMIVAINTDPRAAIFSYADYCIVEDVLTFLPVFLEKYKKFSKS